MLLNNQTIAQLLLGYQTISAAEINADTARRETANEANARVTADNSLQTAMSQGLSNLESRLIDRMDTKFKTIEVRNFFSLKSKIIGLMDVWSEEREEKRNEGGGEELRGREGTND
jgi:hypothetical protein